MSTQVNSIIWNMTRKCNFRCEYCYFPHDNTPVTQTLPVNRIKRFLDGTGNTWVIRMTGGEPFIYPNIVNICDRLSETHIIGIDTNLSVTSRIREFAERIDPSRVENFYAALHIEERERVKGVDAFINNARLLMDSGFNVIINYVVHPTLEDRFMKDVQFYGSHGIEITPRPFRGEFEGRRYPEAYGDRAQAIFANHPEQGKKIAYNFEGIPCTAGQTLLRMEPDGTVFRCPGDRTVLGNILESVELYDGPRPCTKKRCPCRGLDHLSLSDAQCYLVEGIQYAVVGDNRASAHATGRTLVSIPGQPCAENNLGVVAWRFGNKKNAVRHFRAALSASPDNALYTANLTGAEADGDGFDPQICLDISSATQK